MQKSSFLLDNNMFNVELLLIVCMFVVHLWSFKFAVSDALFCLLKITEFIGRSSYVLCYHDSIWICDVPNIIPNRSLRTNYYFCFLIRREIRNTSLCNSIDFSLLTDDTGRDSNWASANHVDRKTSIKFIFLLGEHPFL